jgi:hemolysin III
MPTEARHDAVEAAALSFPRYTSTEAAADRVLHLCALPTATASVGWLLLTTLPTASVGQAIAEIIYGLALVGMLTASAAYNLSRSASRKELLRRIDHAMIFVMIAGTYTPFTLVALRHDSGPLLCALIWSLASIGIVMKLVYPRRFERFMFAVYLMMGWIFLGLGRGLAVHLSAPVFLLLMAGGAAYSVGALLHAYGRPQFHNAAWHALVLLGVGLHWLAIARLSRAAG